MLHAKVMYVFVSVFLRKEGVYYDDHDKFKNHLSNLTLDFLLRTKYRELTNYNN